MQESRRKERPSQGVMKKSKKRKAVVVGAKRMLGRRPATTNRSKAKRTTTTTLALAVNGKQHRRTQSRIPMRSASRFIHSFVRSCTTLDSGPLLLGACRQASKARKNRSQQNKRKQNRKQQTTRTKNGQKPRTGITASQMKS